MLDQLIPTPRLLEMEHAGLAAAPRRVWQVLRQGELATAPLIRALFRIDNLRSSADTPGFQLLAEESSRELVVGAIGKGWQIEIPFAQIPFVQVTPPRSVSPGS